MDDAELARRLKPVTTVGRTGVVAAAVRARTGHELELSDVRHGSVSGDARTDRPNHESQHAREEAEAEQAVFAQA